MIRNILVFLFYFSYIQASYCQSLSINNILEESYSNFIKLCLPNWLSNHKIKYFYLLETYNPVGFNSDKITNNVVNKKTDLKLNYKGQIIYEKGYRKNNYYIGYPDIFMIGPDTIGVNISLSYFNNQRSSAFAGSFISLFKISIYNDGFSEIKLSQDSINNIIKNAKLNKQIIGLDSIYIKAIKLAITNLDYDNILIYDKYFPMWVLLSDSMKPYRHLYITHIKKHQRLNNKNIIGWPIIHIHYGNLSISLNCFVQRNKKNRKFEISKANYLYDSMSRTWKYTSKDLGKE